MLVCTFGTVDDRYSAPHSILDTVNYALWFRGYNHDLHLLLLCVNHVHYARIDKNAECRIKGIRPAKNGPCGKNDEKIENQIDCSDTFAGVLSDCQPQNIQASGRNPVFKRQAGSEPIDRCAKNCADDRVFR